MKYLRDDFCLHVGCWLCRWLRNQSWKPRVPEHSRASGRLHRWDQGRQRQREKKKRPNNLPRPFCTFLWLVFHLWLKRSHRLSLTDCRRGPAANPPPPPPPKKPTVSFELINGFEKQCKFCLMAFRSSVSPLSFLHPTGLRSLHWRSSSNQGWAYRIQTLKVFSTFFTSVFPYVVIFVPVNGVIVFISSVFQWFWMVLTGERDLLYIYILLLLLIINIIVTYHFFVRNCVMGSIPNRCFYFIFEFYLYKKLNELNITIKAV